MDQQQPSRPQPATVSRRDALRTGAVVAGAAWAVPVLTVVGATPAHADRPSPAVQPGAQQSPPPAAAPQQPQPAVQPALQPAAAPAARAEAAAAGPALAQTGSEAVPVAVAGAALVAAGAAALVAGRRQEPTPDGPTGAPRHRS